MTARPIRRKLSKRERLTGRRVSGQHYAMIPLEVIECEAYACLPDYATRVLAVLAAQYRGGNNGDLSLPAPYAKARGIRGPKLYAGLDLLQRVGLVTKTRQGGKKPMRCSLYALEWRKVDESTKFDAGHGGTLAPRNIWAQWVTPSDWEATKKAVLNKQRGGPSRSKARAVTAPRPAAESRSHREGQIAPTSGGLRHAHRSHRGERSNLNAAPTVGETF